MKESRNVRTRFRLVSVKVVVLLGLTVPAVTAQITSNVTDGTTPPGVAPGAPAGSFALGEFDTVNLYSGNLNFRLPLLEVVGRGEARHTITLPIESRWTIDRSSYADGTTIYYPIASWWPSLAVGYGPGILEGRNAREQEFCADGSTIVTYTLLRLTFIAPDGTEYELRDKLTDGQPWFTGSTCSYAGGSGRNRGREFVSRDGTTVTFLSDADLVDNLLDLAPALSGYLMFRDGTRYRINQCKVDWIRDRNGNLLTFQYDTQKRVTRITDSLQRTVEVSYPAVGATPPFADIITYKGFGGAQRQIRINRNYMGSALRSGYALKTMRELFPDLDTPYTSTYNPVVVTSVQLPDNRQYQLFYNSYGELARAVLPTGGSLEYDFPLDSGVANNRTMVHRPAKQRRVCGSDCQSALERRTYFDEAAIGPQVVTVRHADASGSTVTLDRHSFYGSPTTVNLAAISYPQWKDGREYQTEYFDSNGVTVLRRENHTWAQRGADNSSVIPPDATAPNDPRIIETVTTLETGQSSKRTYRYSLDPYNNRTDTYEYDYGATAPTRRTHVDYVTSPSYTDVSVHLRNLPLQQSVFDAGGVERARTTYEYDNYASDANHAPLFPRSGISQLDAGFTTSFTRRGNVTATSRWLLPSGPVLASYQQYDVAGNVVKTINPRGHATTLAYGDNFGGPNAEARTNTPPAELAGQASFAYRTQVSNPLGHVSYTQYDYYLGKPVDQEDPNRVVTTTAYSDPLDRITQVVRANNTAIRNQVSFSYNDPARTITTTRDLDTYGDNQLKDELIYDSRGRTVETRQYESATLYIASKQAYDAMGRLRQVSNPYRPGSEALLYTTTDYDSLGRVKRITRPDGAMVDTRYYGNQTLFVDEAAKQRISTRDALGRLVTVTESPESLAYQTTYQYNVLDNLTVVFQGAQTRSFAYDSLGRLTSATNPESGTVSYQYDNNGNVTQKSDARGTISYVYDALNRLTSRSYTDGMPLVTYAYDAVGVAYSKGRLTSVSSTVTTYGYDEYDALGRIRRSSQVTGGNQYLFGYTYNLAGKTTSQTYPSGRKVTTGYDLAARPNSLSGEKAGEPNKTYASLTLSASYAAHGTIHQMQLGNGLWEHTNFNSRLQPTQIGLGSTSTGTSVFGLDYGYGTINNNGNVLSQIITAPGFSKTQSYAYDALNRLQQADEVGSWSQAYGYDRYGNRWVISSSYIPKPTLTPQSQSAFNPANNRLSASQYDAAGNQTQDALGNAFTYDLENHQKTFNGTTATYAYDGENRRVKKAEAGGTTIFVYNALGQLAAEYSDLPPSGTTGTSYLTVDHLGSTRLITDAAGAVKKRYDYLPFGEEIPASIGGRSAVPGYPATDSTRQRFTGKERDAESGLDYFGARYHSGAQGRFMSPDPYNLPLELSKAKDAEERSHLRDSHIGRPQVWNRYAYTLNNPLRFVDPKGECSKPANQQQGDTGICIEAFIATKWFGRIGRGDDRTFSGSDPTLTARSRFKLVISPEGTIKSQEVESARSGILIKGLGLMGTTNAEVNRNAPNEDGSRTLEVFIVGVNGEHGLPIAPEGPLQGIFNFTISNGSVELNRRKSAITDFPSWGVYSYGSDPEPKKLLEAREKDAAGLQRPPVPLAPDVK